MSLKRLLASCNSCEPIGIFATDRNLDADFEQFSGNIVIAAVCDAATKAGASEELDPALSADRGSAARNDLVISNPMV